MAEDRKAYMIKDDNLGEVRIADEVVAIIAGLAALEVGNINIRIAGVDLEKRK